MAELTMDQICSTLKAWSDAANLVRDAKNAAVKTMAESKRILDDATGVREQAQVKLAEAKQEKADADARLAQATAEAQRLVANGQAEAERIVSTAHAQKDSIYQAVARAREMQATVKEQTATLQAEYNVAQANLLKAREQVASLLAH